MARATGQTNTARVLRDERYEAEAETYLRGINGARTRRVTGARTGTARQPLAVPQPGAAARPVAVPKSGAAARPVAVSVRGSHLIRMTAVEQLRMIAAVAVIGAMFLGVIFLTAYGASVQKDINRANARISVIGEEIESLNLAIERGRNIETIKQRAAGELGMIYPGGNQLKYLEEVEIQPIELAQFIKEKAYGA
ncbi:MAG: hypothetical protein LBO81_06790 [Clostridiales Family XIII bacterium]|jgi:cell division protein FtsL|nr:hypothetical protein [Clostridiales Family XIII bacterium]